MVRGAHEAVTVRQGPRPGIVWDNHGCLPLRGTRAFLPQIERYRASGFNVISLNVGFGEMSFAEHLANLTLMREWIASHSDAYALVSTIDDIERCKAEGKLGVVFDVEGMVPVQDDPSRVRTLYELGVRWMLIAYNRANAAGGGCLEPDGGLTATGRAIIDEMQRVGMVLCLSHTGARTAMDAMGYSRNPVIFTHSNPYGHTPHPRNITDDLIRACARTGGVVGLSGIGPFLGASEHLVPRLIDQLRYVIDLVGAEHVGLSLDFVFDTAELDEHVRLHPHLYPAGVNGRLAMVAPEALAQIAEGLASAHLSDEEIAGVLGQNWLRVASRIWRRL